MTTTPNQTAERVAHGAIWGKRLIDPGTVIFSNDAHAISTAAVGALRAAGLLSEGTPSEEQIERAARAMEDHYDRWSGPGENAPTYAELAEAALTAAGVTPQPLNPEGE